MGVAPNILYAGSSGNQLTFTYTADSSSLRGQTLVEFPRGWTAPQRRNASGPGYVELRAGQCAASTKILSVGVRKVTIATNCKRHQSYQLVYSNVTAPQLTADGYVFLALTRSTAGGRKAKFRALLPGKQPVVKVKGGPPFVSTCRRPASRQPGRRSASPSAPSTPTGTTPIRTS